MGISIPLGVGTTSPNPAAPGVNIPLTLGGASGGGSARETSILRAAATAAALADPQTARVRAKQGLDSPEDVPALGSKETPKDRLDDVLQAVNRALTDRSNAAAANDSQSRVSQAVGADPVLVRAASDAITEGGEQQLPADQDRDPSVRTVKDQRVRAVLSWAA